ncbi:MAG: DoxX family protein [Pirellulaceae bacterium]|jgi:putative oxidoreductase
MLLGTQKQIDSGLFVLRVAIGCFMLVHGIQKLMGFSEMADKFPDPIGMGSQLSLVMAIGAEVGCSLLLILGLGTRIAVIPLAFTMIVALFVVHAADPWKVKELAAIFLTVYAVIFITGPGRCSLDGRLFCKTRVETSNQ